VKLVRHVEGKRKIFQKLSDYDVQKKMKKIWMFKNDVMDNFDSND